MRALASSQRPPTANRGVALNPQTNPAPVDGLPPGLDPKTHPVICRHIFGIEPPPSARDLRFKHDVERLHRLGPRALHELLSELGATRQILTLIENRTAQFASIDPDALTATGGDRFPPAPIHQVRP